jgi:hypothetical protein
VFAIRVAVEDRHHTPDQIAEIRTIYVEMRETERRLVRVGSLVTRALDRVLPGQPAQVYGRSGQVGG